MYPTTPLRPHNRSPLRSAASEFQHSKLNSFAKKLSKSQLFDHLKSSPKAGIYSLTETKAVHSIPNSSRGLCWIRWKPSSCKCEEAEFRTLLRPETRTCVAVGIRSWLQAGTRLGLKAATLSRKSQLGSW
jgi:hypothetical protein